MSDVVFCSTWREVVAMAKGSLLARCATIPSAAMANEIFGTLVNYVKLEAQVKLK